MPSSATPEQVRERSDDPEWDSAPLGVLRAYNVLFIPSRRTTNDLQVRRATDADVPAIIELRTKELRGRLFAPLPDDPRILRAGSPCRSDESTDNVPPEYWVAERHGRLEGIAGFWDTDRVHRTRVLRLSRRARLNSLAYGILRHWYGLTPLPTVGEVVRGLCTVDVAIRRRDPEILRSLLNTALRAYIGRGLHFLQIGFMTTDPLCEALREYRTVPFESHLVGWFRQSWSKRVGVHTMTDPYVDLALL